MTQHNNTPQEENIDRKLRSLFHSSHLEAPPSPWFTRKVLNRLPDRKRRVASIIEYALYIIGIITTVCYTVSFIRQTLQNHMITIGDVTVYCVLVALFLSLCFMLITPFTSRSDA